MIGADHIKVHPQVVGAKGDDSVPGLLHFFCEIVDVVQAFIPAAPGRSNRYIDCTRPGWG